MTTSSIPARLDKIKKGENLEMKELLVDNIALLEKDTKSKRRSQPPR